MSVSCLALTCTVEPLPLGNIEDLPVDSNTYPPIAPFGQSIVHPELLQSHILV